MTKVQRLSDGKLFTALCTEHTQPDMFNLSRSFKWKDPQTGDIFSSKIANPNQLDDALNNAKVYKKVLGYDLSRSDQIVFYKPGSGKTYDQIDKKIVWIEERLDNRLNQTGQLLVAILDLSEISKERVLGSNRRETPLQQAKEMGVISLSKLLLTKTEEDSKILVYFITITPDFDPKTDLKIKDVPAPNNWSKVIDSDGYPLEKGRISTKIGWKEKNARLLVLQNSDDFSNIKYFSNIQYLFTTLNIKHEDLGYFGSIAFCGDAERIIYANLNWSLPSKIPLVVDQNEVTALEK